LIEIENFANGFTLSMVWCAFLFLVLFLWM